MIAGIGVDIVTIERIRQKEHLYEQYLSPEDIRYVRKFRNHWEHAAGFWAAKEALVKALNDKTLAFTKISVLHDDNGHPYFDYQPSAGVIHLSISHEKEEGDAVAVVIWEVPERNRSN